jgi:hypothetical protein
MLAVPVFGRPDFDSGSPLRRSRETNRLRKVSREVCFVFAPLCLTALERPRHSWMLDVAKKMLGSRASAGVRDDDAVAQLRRQL